VDLKDIVVPRSMPGRYSKYKSTNTVVKLHPEIKKDNVEIDP